MSDTYTLIDWCWFGVKCAAVVVITLLIINAVILATPLKTSTQPAGNGTVVNIYSYAVPHFLEGSTTAYVIEIDPPSSHLLNITISCDYYRVGQSVGLTATISSYRGLENSHITVRGNSSALSAFATPIIFIISLPQMLGFGPYTITNSTSYSLSSVPSGC